MNGLTDGFKSRIKPEDKHLAYKDAIFISPHKMLGGPNSTGIIVAKKSILFERIKSNNENEESEPKYKIELIPGTPDIIGTIRAGLTFGLKIKM